MMPTPEQIDNVRADLATWTYTQFRILFCDFDPAQKEVLHRALMDDELYPRFKRKSTRRRRVQP